MKELNGVILVCALLALLSAGCAVVASPVSGFLYTDVKGPVDSTDGAIGQKRGEACAISILGIVAVGDASIDTAKRNGGITEIQSVDHQSTSCLTLYGKFCTLVTGK